MAVQSSGTALPAAIEAIDRPGSPSPVCSIIVKLAARCNLACTYCYWFRDATVMDAPKLMTDGVRDAFIERLRRHFERYSLGQMALILHGGEPLLYGKTRFARLCEQLRSLEKESGTAIQLQLTTNGALIDEEWAALVRCFAVSTTVSIDGSAKLHDRRRPDLLGRGTHAQVVRGIEQLRQFGIEPGILAVADPETPAADTLRYFFEELRCGSLDFLIPDATHDGASPQPIAEWFVEAFDCWFDRYAKTGAEIRLFQGMIRSLCGISSGVESIGYGPIASATVCTDGALEAHDVVRITGNGATASRLNVLSNEIDEIATDPLWRELHAASLQLAPVCNKCPWRFACGGGHIASRWSFENRFNNPSVYCGDLKSILAHVWHRIAPTLTIQSAASGPEGKR